jgi:hypothetical protein
MIGWTPHAPNPILPGYHADPSIAIEKPLTARYPHLVFPVGGKGAETALIE